MSAGGGVDGRCADGDRAYGDGLLAVGEIAVRGYFVLRSSVDEPERRATFAAVVAIIATIDVPICFMITRLIPSSIHPVVLREGGMSPEMGLCVGLCALGMLLVGFVLYRTRFNQVRHTQRVEALKETVDDER